MAVIAVPATAQIWIHVPVGGPRVSIADLFDDDNDEIEDTKDLDPDEDPNFRKVELVGVIEATKLRIR